MANVLKISPELYDELSRLDTAYINEKGQEVLNPKPTVLELTTRPPSLKEQIQRLVKSELSLQAMSQGRETFEEANDFEVDDDPMPTSQFEMMAEEFLPPEQPSSLTTPEGGHSSQAAPTPEAAAPVEDDPSLENPDARA